MHERGQGSMPIFIVKKYFKTRSLRTTLFYEDELLGFVGFWPSGCVTRRPFDAVLREPNRSCYPSCVNTRESKNVRTYIFILK